MRVRQESAVSVHSPVVCRMALPRNRERFVHLTSVEMDNIDTSSTSSISTRVLPDLRDVLERDQRTVLTRSRQPRQTTTSCSIFYYNITSNSHNKLQRFGEVLTLCACILGIVSLPTTMSAPIDGNPIDINKPPKWINPCPSGQVPSQGFDEFIVTDHNSDLPTSREILDRIVLMARNAIHEVEFWREAYTQHAFKKDFQSNVDMWKNLFDPSKMQWLPSDKITGKQLGQPLSDELKKSLDRNAVLQTTYQWLQSAAVGLEQITADQYKNNEPFKKNFSDAFFALNLILCEIHAALTEFNVNKLPDIGRDVMSDVERKPLYETERNLRDWFILVKYLNILEYTESAFKYLSEHS